MSREMTVDDLMAAVAAYHAGPPRFEEGDGPVTAAEVAARMGRSIDVAQRTIRKMVAANRLEAGQRRVIKADGSAKLVPAYKLRG